MREAEVTDQQIIDAGNDLLAKGRKVTKSGLRQHLGAGNFDRLLAVWQQYENALNQIKRESVELPEDLETAIQGSAERFVSDLRHLYSAISDRAMRTAGERVSEIDEACRRKLIAASEDSAAAERENERLNAESSVVKVELSGVLVRLDDAQHELQNLRVMHSKMKDQLIDTTGDNKMSEVELRTLRHQISEMTKERDQFLERHQQQLESMQGQISESREQLAYCKGQITALEQAIVVFNQQNNSPVSQAI